MHLALHPGIEPGYNWLTVSSHTLRAVKSKMHF